LLGYTLSATRRASAHRAGDLYL